MSLRINQNVTALSTYGTLNQTSGRLEKSIQKLSSGMRINGAADDAAGLAISEKMRRQIRGLSRATHNAQDGISMIQTAEGALNESQSILQRMRELAVQASNDTLTTNDRIEIQKEVDQLKDELCRIANTTEFNTKKLLNGSQTALLSSSSNSVRGFAIGDIEGSGNYRVEMETVKGGAAEMQRSQIFTVLGTEGELADGSTQLQSIAEFYDDSGVFVLDTPQALNLHGNGNTTQVHLDGQMTLDNLAANIQNGITRDSGLSIKNSTVATINTVQSKLSGVGGYLQVVSGSIGSAGSVSISGDQRVIDALGMDVTREAVESQIMLTARDGFGNVRQITTEADRAFGLLDGIDLQFDSQAAQVAGTQGIEQGIKFTVAQSFSIEAGGKTLSAEVVAGDWTMGGIVRNLNEQFEDDTDGIVGLKASLVDGEVRLSYERPISAGSSIANSITIDTSGGNADTIGFVDGTYAGFVDGQKDQSQLLMGFSTYVEADSAPDDIDFKIGDGVNTISVGVSLTNDKSEADMKVFTEFQADVNNTAKTQSVAVRVDQVGGAMVFTSLRVGTENIDNGPNIESRVSLNFNESDESTALQQRLGLNDGVVARGAGDTNFRFHVVDRRNQLQIGADQGQTMNFAISEMSSEALGIDRIDMTTVEGASEALGALNKAIDTVSAERSKLGAVQNRLEFAINNLRNTHSNLSAAESRVRDADIAMEMIEFTRNQIVSQSGNAMLAQANMTSQMALQLIG